MRFVGDLGHKIADATKFYNVDREVIYLFQQLSICLQWFNAVLLDDIFPESDASDLWLSQ